MEFAKWMSLKFVSASCLRKSSNVLAQFSFNFVMHISGFGFDQERTKALGYLSANKVQAEEVLQALDEKAARRPLDNINELHIKVISCAKLKSRRDGKT